MRPYLAPCHSERGARAYGALRVAARPRAGRLASVASAVLHVDLRVQAWGVLLAVAPAMCIPLAGKRKDCTTMSMSRHHDGSVGRPTPW